MKNFSIDLKDKVEDLTHSIIKKENKKIEHLLSEFKKYEYTINEKINKTIYLLDLIDDHKIIPLEDKKTSKDVLHKDWFEELVISFEKINFKKSNELTPEEIKIVKREKGVLNSILPLLKKEQKYLLTLIAKSTIHLMEARELDCKSITKGEGIVQIGQNLLDEFGKKSDLLEYETGRLSIIHFIRKQYGLNKINAHKVFNILEKSKLVVFEVDPNEILTNIEFDSYVDANVSPLIGSWRINA